MEESTAKNVISSNEQENNSLREAISTYDYPTFPTINSNLRNDPKVSIISNLFPIEYIDSIHTIANYSIEFLPTISDENYPLKRVIQQHLESLLPEEFKRTFFAGNNLFACIANYQNKNLSSFEFSTTVNKVEYKIKINKAKEIDFSQINNNDDKEIQQITLTDNYHDFFVCASDTIFSGNYLFEFLNDLSGEWAKKPEN